MINRSLILTVFILFLALSSMAQNGLEVEDNATAYLKPLIIPAIIAALGYILKIIYESISESAKMRRDLLEEKLKNFYWPILTRLEQNTAIWTLILSKRSKLNELEKKIGLYVEENIIMKNHREIMSIIIDYRYHAKFDEAFESRTPGIF